MENGIVSASSPPMHRRAIFEDRAKPVWVSLPFVAVAAVAVVLFGHFVSSRKGRQLGRGDKKKPAKKSDSASLGAPVPTPPSNLADLRRLRAEAAEARVLKGTTGKSDASAVKPTPLGMILAVTRKVDQLEKQAADFFSEAGGNGQGDADKQKVLFFSQEQFRLLELLTQVQLEIDGITVNDSVRQHRKTQTTRVQKLISALEGSIPVVCVPADKVT